MLEIIELLKQYLELESSEIEKTELELILKNEMKKIETEITSLQIVNRFYQYKIDALQLSKVVGINQTTPLDSTIKAITDLPSFELKKTVYLDEQPIGDQPKNEKTIEGLNIDTMIQDYHHPYPPQPLTDSQLNKEIIELELQNELLLFFRFFTHPFKHEFDLAERKYLYYIMCEREITPKVMKYLLSGTEGENIDFDALIREYEDIDSNDLFNDVSSVEEYIDLLGVTLEEDKSSDIHRFKFVLEPKDISITIIPKKTLFRKDNTLKYFTDYMKKYGFFHKVLLD